LGRDRGARGISLTHRASPEQRQRGAEWRGLASLNAPQHDLM